jgi:hypothetical protein
VAARPPACPPACYKDPRHRCARRQHSAIRCPAGTHPGQADAPVLVSKVLLLLLRPLWQGLLRLAWSAPPARVAEQLRGPRARQGALGGRAHGLGQPGAVGLGLGLRRRLVGVVFVRGPVALQLGQPWRALLQDGRGRVVVGRLACSCCCCCCWRPVAVLLSSGAPAVALVVAQATADGCSGSVRSGPAAGGQAAADVGQVRAAGRGAGAT